MKNSIVVLTLSLFFCNACNNSKKIAAENYNDSKKEDLSDKNWVNLFDGKTTKGWHSYGKATAGEAWKTENGTLYLDTTKKDGWQTTGGDLCTDEAYENFHLSLEWKIASNGNSGIIFLINEDTPKYQYSWHTGLEMQVLDNNGHSDGKIIKHRAGDLYDLIKCSKETVKPVGEWNVAEIVCNNGKLNLFLNGTNVVTTILWDDNWANLKANSKFKSMPGFSNYKKGKIALQDHGNMVWYRNIKIKQL